jgi:hypothetical protein
MRTAGSVMETNNSDIVSHILRKTELQISCGSTIYSSGYGIESNVSAKSYYT